jgi:hypothetical protein
MDESQNLKLANLKDEINNNDNDTISEQDEDTLSK